MSLAVSVIIVSSTPLERTERVENEGLREMENEYNTTENDRPPPKNNWTALPLFFAAP